MRLVLLLLLTASAFAQNAKVDALFTDVDKPDSPGYAVAVIQDGKVVHARGYGMADLERDVKITPRSVFDIGSTAKQFTAASILLLEAEGKLSLSDDIRKYLPEMPAYERPVTIAHLIHHTSGIRDYLTLMGLAGLDDRNDFTDEETVALIARQKALNFLPGDEHLYSNSGYYLLSQIVERASGRSLRGYADEKIFKPLGMTSTHFHDDPTEIVKHRAIGYAPSKNGYVISMSNYHVTGDGALYTTVEDLAKWDANFYDPKVGGQALLDAQHRVGKLTSGKELTYAAGLGVRKHEGLRMVEHGGAWMGYRAQLVRFPEKKLSVALLSNLASANPGEKALKIAELYLDLKPAAAAAPAPAPAAISVPAEELARYAKTYFNKRGGGYRRVEVRDGKLLYGPRELRPVGGAKFALDGPTPAFITFRENSALIEVEGEAPNEIPAVQLVTPDAAALAQYAGDYRSEELQGTHRLRVKDGALHLRAGYDEERKLEPRERDVFESRGVLVRFQRTNGAISGYTIAAGRVTNIAFVRK
jgi:CubicO group peptidase (beta-lactamase class C family)